MIGYFLLYIVVAIWLFLDAGKRRYTGIPWAIATVIFGPVIVPFYLAKRPLKNGEVREGGFGWNVLKNFALFWTITIFVGFVAGLANVSHVAANAHSDAEMAGAGIGLVLGGAMIFGVWFVVLLGALVLGFFLKKSSIVERGPTGPLLEAR